MARLSFRKLHLRWRDPRFVAGLVLVALSTAAGGYLLAGPETVPVYRARATILPGTSLTQAKLELVDVSPELAHAYFGPDNLDKKAVTARTIRKGELLSAESLADAAVGGTRLVVPLAVAAPSNVSEGDTVSLWAVAKSSAGANDAGASELTNEALLVSLDSAESLSVSGARAELIVPDDVAATVLALLGTDSSFVVTTGGSQ